MIIQKIGNQLRKRNNKREPKWRWNEPIEEEMEQTGSSRQTENTEKLDVIMANYLQARKMRQTQKLGAFTWLVFSFSFSGLFFYSLFFRIPKITDQQKRQRLVNSSSSSSNVLQLNNEINKMMTMVHSTPPCQRIEFFYEGRCRVLKASCALKCGRVRTNKETGKHAEKKFIVEKRGLN